MTRLTPQQLQARKKRNLAIAAALVGFIVLVFAVTVLNLKRNIDARKEAIASGQPVEYARCSGRPARSSWPSPARQGWCS